MGSPRDAALANIDSILRDIERSPAAGPRYTNYSHLSDDQREAAAVRCRAAIMRFAPKGSAYADAAQPGPYYPQHQFLRYLGALRGLREDIAGGYLAPLQELVHAEVFDDFLEMASELQTKGYKDAAAVVAGSVLEEHLRKLATKHGISVERDGGDPKKAAALNDDLKREGVHNQLSQKSVAAWLDLRNNAAHGKYDEYDHREVARLIDDVRAFLTRLPA